MLTLSLITVNYHSEAVLQRLLSSFPSLLDPPPTEWIIVNHTPDDPDLEKRLIPPAKLSSFKVILYPENKGFGDGCNRGARNSTGQILFFLNPDCRFEGGSLTALLKRFEDDTQIAALGPLIRNSQNEVEFSFARFPGIFSEAFLKVEKRLGTMSTQWMRRRFSHSRYVDWATAGAVLMRREAFLKVGGFDDGFFLYFEDTDLCKRLHQAGFRIGFDPSFSLIHDHGQGGSAQTARGKPSTVYRQSQVRYYQKHKGKLSQLALKIYLRLTGKIE